MIKLDLNAMLDTMSKAQILEQLESQIDTAIARKIEQETMAKEYNEAKMRVANDTYSASDLAILQKRLDRLKGAAAMEDLSTAKKIRHEGAYKGPGLDPKAFPIVEFDGKRVAKNLDPTELNEILGSLFAGRGLGFR